MNFNYKFVLDKRTKRTTVLAILCCEAAVVFLYYFLPSGGTYVAGWLAVFCVLCFLYAFISVPRRLVVTDAALEIRCVVELVVIPKENIRSVKRLPRASLRYFIPVYASSGFGGYFGWYYNLVTRKFVRLYASKWENFIQIEDKFGKLYIVSCDETHKLIASIR